MFEKYKKGIIDMQRKYSYARKYGISSVLKKMIDKYDSRNEQAFGQLRNDRDDIFFNSRPVLYIMRELLSYTSLPSANRKMNVLNDEYRRYCESHRNADFQIEELFQEGWLSRRIDEWSFSFEYGLRRLDTKHEKLHTKQIVGFLKKLRKKLNRESKLLKVNIASKNLQRFLEQCSVNDKWLLKHEILCQKRGEYYINPFSEVWKKYGDMVISEYINSRVEKEQLFERWMDLAAAFPRCRMTNLRFNDLELLYDSCLAYLERETGTWEEQETCFLVFISIEQGNLNSGTDGCMDIDSDRYHTWERRCSIWHQYQYLYGTRQDIAFRFCIERYYDVSRELTARFRKLLKVPAYYIDFFCVCTRGNIAIFADCIEENGIQYEAIVSIHKWLLHDASNFGKVSMEDLHQFGVCVQDVLYNDVFLSLKDSDRDRYELFINWMLYLYEYERRHLLDLRGMGYQNRKKGDLYQGILEWICKELIPAPHKAESLLSVLEERILSCKDEKVHSYYGMALDAAGVCRDSVLIDQEQIAKTFLNIFLVWCEKVRRNDISVFGIDWDLFDKDVWGDLIAVYNEEFFEKFLCAYEGFKNDLWEGDKDVKSLQGGKLFLIYCYIASFSLVRFRNVLSQELGIRMESILSQDYLALHKKFRFFTGDHIDHWYAQKVVKECMKTLLVISDGGREEFAKGLRPLKSPDLLFWDGCADSEIIRRAYMDVLSDMDKEVINKAVYSVPMYIQMAEQIFRLSFELIKNNSPKDKKLLDKLAGAAEMLLEVLEGLKGNPYVEKNQAWMKTARCRLLMLQGKESEVLSGGNKFYKGIIYMNSDDYDKIRKAEEIFSGLFERQSVSGTINYLITLAVLILKGNKEQRDVRQDLERFEMVKKYMISNWDIFPDGKEYVFYYALLVDMELGDRADAWHMEQLLKHDKQYENIICNPDIAKALVSFYALENEESLAENVIEIYDKHGEVRTANELWKLLKDKSRQHGGNRGGLAQSPGISLNDAYDKELLKHVMNLVKGSEMDIQAYVMLPKAREVEKNEYKKYESDRLSGIAVVHILHMIFQAVCKLQEYKYDFLKNGSMAREDTYNRFFMRLFNDMNSLTGYVMCDQSQGGKTGNKYQNGEMVPGERDHILKFDNQEIMLIEGIRQNRKYIIKKSVAEHINKLENYNASGMSLALILIYAGFDEMDQQWEKYISLLETYQGQGSYGMISIEKIFLWKDAGLNPPNHFICRTHHKYQSGYEVFTYHIMVRMK